ncbi:TMEM175 family protein [Actinocatenispora sera]|uniref:TMEM175 family protein n=1 Tax=Actinocatenispora sera TaxID=390989 RepID=UPI00340A00FE
MVSPDSIERSRDLDRLLTFVDAAVAIALTLLVLPLVDLAGELESGDAVWQAVREHAGRFAAFALSFVVIARLWRAQHQIVRGAVDDRVDLFWCLLAWALTIVFLPFPTALLAATGDQVATKILYIGALLVSSALLALLAAAVRRQRPPGSPLRPSVIPAAVDAVVDGVALLLSVLVPALSYLPLLLLVVGGHASTRILRRWPRLDH